MVCFYDRSIKLWTAYRLDGEGNQCSKTGYGVSKKLAIDDIGE